jgi:RNA polymerase sigma factor (TIGR02999 family)
MHSPKGLRVMRAQHEITEQLFALRDSNDPAAWDDLIPVVYAELRAIAHRQLQRERRDRTLSTTALVHEAYLRLVDQRRTQWQDRAHFFAIASRMMRRILIDSARRHRASKRGGADERVPFEETAPVTDNGPGAADDLAAANQRADVLVALDDALNGLAALDARLVRVVECRFFGGLTEEETAATLGVTARTVRRDWVKAKGWLQRALHD